MNTRTSEIKLALQEVLAESLQQGIAPDLLELINTRQFKQIGVVRDTTKISDGLAISDEINDNLEKIEQYMDVLDLSSSLQLDKILDHRGSFNEKIQRLERWYRKLATKAQALVSLIRTGTSALYVISEDFSSLDNLDMDNTTAYIDTVAGIAEINFSNREWQEDADSGPANVSISSAVLKDGSKTVPIPFDNNNLSYKYLSESESGIECDIRLKVSLANEEYNNGRVSFKMLFPENTKIVSITGTSDNYTNSEDMFFLQSSEYIFIPVSKLYKSKEITIKLIKTTHEGSKIDNKGKVEHQFIFDISDVKLPNRVYRTSGTIRTTDYTLPKFLSERGIAQFQLVSDSYLFGDTKVAPMVSLNGGEFSYIDFNTIIPIGSITNGKMYHPSFSVIRDNPSPICKLAGGSTQFVPNESWLIEGYNQAEIDSVAYTASHASLSHWVRNSGIKAHQDIPGAGIYLAGGMSHKVYFCINSSKTTDIVLRNIGVRQVGGDAFNQATYMYLYFNGQLLSGTELADGTIEYRTALIKGDNNLNMIIGLSGDGGYLNLGNQFISDSSYTYIAKRHSTSMAGIISMDNRTKAYAEDNGALYINYVPPEGTKFLHKYVSPTTSLPRTIALAFEMTGVDDLSPFINSFKLEFSTGSVL